MQNGAGLNSIGSNITTTNTALSFGTGVTLTASVQFSTQASAGVGTITLSGTVSPTTTQVEGLTLVAGTGNIVVAGPVGTAVKLLGDLGVTSGATVGFTGAVYAKSFTESLSVGHVSTTFAAGQTYANNFAFTGAILNVNDAMSVGGTTTITNSGLFTKSTTNAITSVGAFVQNGAGLNSIGSNITTTNTALSFGTGVTLTASVVFSTTAAGNLVLSSTLDGAHSLAVTAGTGTASFVGVIGTASASANRPSGLIINTSGALSFGAPVWINGDVTIRSSSVTFGGSFNAEGTGNVALYGRTAGQTIDIGLSATYLPNSSLANLNTARTITIGESGVQSGLVTFKTAALAASLHIGSNLTTVTINSDAGIGQVAFDDNATSTAFDATGAVSVNVNAGSGGITAVSATGSQAEIGTTGSLTLNTTGAIGSTTNRLQFPAGQAQISVTKAPLGAWFDGLGTLSFGAISTQSTGSAGLDVTTQASGNISLTGQVTTTTGDIALAPAGTLILSVASPTAILTSSSANWTIIGPVNLAANTLMTMSGGLAADKIWFKGTTSTIDSPTTAHSLSITAGGAAMANQEQVVFDGAIGAANPLTTLTVDKATSISIANVGNSGTSLAGATGTLSMTTGSGGITFSGVYYQTGGNQTWYGGGANPNSTPAPTVLATSATSTTWSTSGKLNIFGQFTGSGIGAIMTMRSNDIALNPAGATYGSWTMGGTSNELHLLTQASATAMNIGFDDGNAAHWNLDQSELTSIDVGGFAASKVVFGDPTLVTGQSGPINIRTTNLSAANGGGATGGIAVDINSNAVGGAVTFDTGSNTGDALNLGSKNLTVNAYASISAAQSPAPLPGPTNNDIITTGIITLNTDAGSGVRIGKGPLAAPPSFTNYFPIVIAVGESSVNVAGNNSLGVWLMGNGANIILGSVSIVGTLTTDIYNTGVIYLTKDVTTGGPSLTYNAPVQLRPLAGASITLTTSSGDVIFNNSLDDFASSSAGTNSLTIAAGTGNVTFSGAVGGSKAIDNLSISSAAGVTLGGGLKTAGTGGNVSIQHTGILAIADTTSLSDIANYDLDLAGTFSESGSGTVQIAGDIRTAAKTITFTTPVLLTGDVALSSGGANIAFTTAATVDSPGTAYQLIANAGSGTVAFGLAVGSTNPPSALTCTSSNGAANAILVSSSARTTGSQTYTGNTTLNGNLTSTGSAGNIGFVGSASPVRLSSTIVITTGGASVGFGSTLDAGVAGTQGLTINSGGGATSFSAAVGSSAELASLSVTSSNPLSSAILASSTIKTLGAQDWYGKTSLNANLATSGAAAAITFHGASSPVTLLASIQIDTSSGNSNVVFGGSVDAATAGSQGLTLTTGTGTATFIGAVGSTASLSYLSVTSTNAAANAIQASSTVKTSGAQDWFGKTSLNGNLMTTGSGGTIRFHAATSPVTLTSTIVIDTSGGGSNVVFDSTLDAGSSGVEGLSIAAGSGTATFSSPVGGLVALAGLSVTSTNTAASAILASSTVRTSGGQDYYGNTTLNGNLTTTGSGGAVTFHGATSPLTLSSSISIDTSGGNGAIDVGGTLNPAAASTQGLTLAAGSGNVIVTGPVGNALRIGALVISSAGDLTFTNAVSATSVSQTAGSGTTLLSGAFDLNTAAGLSLTGSIQTINAPITTTNGGVLTFANSGLLTLAADIAADGAITQTGAGSVTIVTPRSITTTGKAVSFHAPLTLSGGAAGKAHIDTTNAGAVTAGASISFGSTVDAATVAPNAELLELSAGSGALTFNGAVGGILPLSWLQIASAASIGGAPKASMPGGDLYIDASSSTITMLSDLAVRKFVLYEGTMNLNGKTLSTLNDFVAYGPAYSPVDHDWLPATNTRFAYPGLLAYTPSGYGAYTGVGAGTFALRPSPAFTGAFSPLDASTVAVGGNFYVNGVDMKGGATWTLRLPDNSASNPVFSNALAPTATRWASSPATYAVAFNMNVAYSKVIDSTLDANGATVGSSFVCAASSIAASGTTTAETNNNVVDGASNSGWQFIRPDFTAVSTIYDDVIKLTFNLQVENSHNEIWSVVNAAASGATVGGIWYNSASPIQLLGAYADPACTQPLNATASYASGAYEDLSTFYIRIVKTGDPEPDASRWNTDATGTSPGAANSTDRGRSGPPVVPPAHRSTIPDLAFLKGLFYAADGKTMGRGYDTNISTSPYSATLDGCAPVLISVRTGQETHVDPLSGQQAYDAHNYFDMQWSEPVKLGDLGALAQTNVRSQVTFAAGEHGGDYSGSTLLGYFTAAGGTATLGATVGVDSSLASPTTSATQSSNSLYRSAATPERLRVYLAGFAEAASSLNSAWTWYWPGYIDSMTMPSGTVGAQPNANLTDAAGNPIDATAIYQKYVPSVNDSSVLSPNNGSNYSNLPVVLGSGTDGNWDTYSPTIAIVRNKTNWSVLSGEIVPLEIADPTIVDRIEFHVLDNATYPLTSTTNPDDMTQRWASARGWIDDAVGSANFTTTSSFFGLPDTRGGARPSRYANGAAVPVSAQTAGGVRDSTLGSVALRALKFWDTSTTTSAGGSDAYNQSFETFVISTFFNSASVNVRDDPYFSLVLKQTQPLAQRWGPNSNLHASYDSSGDITDLAGNRLHSVTDVATFVRIPPRFILALSIADSTGKKLYVKFSKSVNVDALVAMNATDIGNVFNFTCGSTLTVVKAERASTSNDEIMLTLDKEIRAGDIINGTFNVKDIPQTDPVTGLTIHGSAIVEDSFDTPLSPLEKHRISDLGLNIVNVVAATDGVHDTPTPVLGAGQSDAPTSSLGALRVFDGSGDLLYRDVTIYTIQNTSGSPPTDQSLRLFYDVAPSTNYAPTVQIGGRNQALGETWLPSVLPGFNIAADTEARSVSPFSAGGAPNFLRALRIPASDSEIKTGVSVGFLLNYGGLFCLRASDPDDPRQFDLFRYAVRDVKLQRGSVTILSNVIDPTKGEKTAVQVVLPKAVTMAVSIFTLDGDLVKRLYLGPQAAGTYTYIWDGRNLSGDPVARGIYFIRVVAGDIDEIRKVLVVRK
ncbi:MAG: hypothetical protein M0001_11915 [Treponema sp.]|nr:hypothetical protein [Treponema sp.]